LVKKLVGYSLRHLLQAGGGAGFSL